MNDRERKAAGQWLRDARKRAGFPSVDAFAEAIGLNKSQVSRYESGTTAVPDERAEPIAEALGLGIITVRRNLGLWVPDKEHALGAGAGESPMDEAERLIAETEHAVELLRRYSRLKGDRRQALMDLARWLDEQPPTEPSDQRSP